MDARVAARLADRFDELGLRFAEPIDLDEIPSGDAVPLTLVHRAGRGRFLASYAQPLTMSATAWAKQHYPEGTKLLLLGPKVNERSAEQFRQLDFNYLDAPGNAFITFEGVHIDVRGRRGATFPDAHDPPTTRGGVNLFSVKRAQVIFAVLMHQELLAQPLRELAAAAGVSLGQTQQTLELLGQYGFVDERRQLVARRRDELIDLWASAFPMGLGSEARTGRFAGEWRRLEPADIAVFVSGEAATTDLRHAETAVFYTDEYPRELIRRRRWRREDAEPTILLRRRFWRPSHPDEPGLHEAPWLLIYADLLASGEARQREAAEVLRERQR